MPLAPSVGIGLGDDDDEVGVLTVGDVGLRAVDHIVVTVADCGGSHPLQIGAGVRLGHGDRAHHLTGRHFRQPALFLSLVAVVENVGCDDGAVHLIAETTHTCGVLCFHDHGFVPVVAATATIFGGHLGAQKSRGSRLQPGFPIDLALG